MPGTSVPALRPSFSTQCERRDAYDVVRKQ
jgi:hypothetical protein